MPVRWRVLSHFWKSPPHYTNFFRRDTCHNNEEEKFLRFISSVFTRSDKKLIPTYCFPLVHCINWAAMLERDFPVYCKRFPNVDPTSRSAKIEANTSTKNLPIQSLRKLTQTLSLLIDWPSYSDIFHKPLPMCECVFNVTGRIFHPETLYCFRISILCLSNSSSV